MSNYTPTMTEGEQNRSVLLIEDDVSLAALLTRALARRGLSVDHVTAAEDALVLLRDGSYSLAVVDLVLSEFSSGFYVVDWLKTHGLHMPVVIMTGAEAKLLANVDRAMVKAILLKPLDPEIFGDMIAAIASRSEPVAATG
jgi:ActR/RegA family two-component response regulator